MRKITIKSNTKGWLASQGNNNTQLVNNKQLHAFIVNKKAHGFNVVFKCTPD